jgi:hypothetical protein
MLAANGFSTEISFSLGPLANALAFASAHPAAYPAFALCVPADAPVIFAFLVDLPAGTESSARLDLIGNRAQFAGNVLGGTMYSDEHFYPRHKFSEPPILPAKGSGGAAMGIPEPTPAPLQACTENHMR